jgi:hypothetical protein
MGTVISLADKSTAWLARSVAAACQGPRMLRSTWQAMAAAGKLPEDIDVSDPDAIDWERIADVLLTMAEFERCGLMGKLPKTGVWCRDATGRLAEIPVPTENRQVH